MKLYLQHKDVDVVSLIDKYTCCNFKIIFFYIKVIRILLFLVEHRTIKMNFSRYNLLPNFTELPFCNKKYEYVSK